MKQPSAKDNALKRCVALSRKLRRDLTNRDTQSIGVGGGVIFRQFGNLALLNQEIRTKYPNIFFDAEIPSEEDSALQHEKRIHDSKLLFITTAVVGCKVNKQSLRTVERMCDKLGMTLVIMICADSTSKVFKAGKIDKRLIEKTLVTRDIRINDNLYLNAIKIQAKNINPLTGLRRFAQGRGSFIAPSPKQTLLTAPRSQQKLPHLQITTGAITDPNYESASYNSMRLAKIADMDHVMGGVIVEVVDNECFHVRHVQIKNGILVDLGHAWGPTWDRAMPAKAVVLGDRHNGSRDEICHEGTLKLLRLLHPESIFLHDICDMAAISYHERNNLTARSNTIKAGNLSVVPELRATAKDIDNLASLCRKVYVVKSNHDEWLDKWIDTGEFVKHNICDIYVAIEALRAKLENRDPLRAVLRNVGMRTKKVKFLTRDSEVRIAQFLCSAHGDEGVARSKPGGPAGLERAFGSGVFGHSHTVCVWHNILQVGTSSFMKMSYTRGLISWMQAHVAIWPTGHWQMYLMIDGKYTTGRTLGDGKSV